MPIRAVVVEDSLLVREGLISLLALEDDIEVVAACATAEEALTAIAAERPDVVLTDIRMPPTQTDEGLRLARELRERDPGLGVIVLSHYVSPESAIAVLDECSDGRGYLLKDRLHSGAALAEALRAVAAGGCRVDPAVVQELLRGREDAAPSALDELTPREREILGDIAEGLSNQAIAERRVLTRRAVEKHASAIFLKLGLANAQDTSRRVKATLIQLAESGR
ncbi:MAG: response regulator transcription factor [Solirubrobacteraceae bacterium]|jgi:DNA-binding NarL/FixJ family response regulator|nr:response regulator transcription factor [Solirubrobacteraceae bacterium]MCU0314268.1 response regulator transcription factor [Solirubrobacteraceae bacterium]